MPEYPYREEPRKWWNDIFRRLRDLERLYFKQQEQAQQMSRSLYSWQSKASLSTGLGMKFFADRNGALVYARAERSSADGTSTASFDVLTGRSDDPTGVSIFSELEGFPTVPAGIALGPELWLGLRGPANGFRFAKGDWFQVNILDTGGGTGPLRVTLHFVDEIPTIPGGDPLG